MSHWVSLCEPPIGQYSDDGTCKDDIGRAVRYVSSVIARWCGDSLLRHYRRPTAYDGEDDLSHENHQCLAIEGKERHR